MIGVGSGATNDPPVVIVGTLDRSGVGTAGAPDPLALTGAGGTPDKSGAGTALDTCIGKHALATDGSMDTGILWDNCGTDRAVDCRSERSPRGKQESKLVTELPHGERER